MEYGKNLTQSVISSKIANSYQEFNPILYERYITRFLLSVNLASLDCNKRILLLKGEPNSNKHIINHTD